MGPVIILLVILGVAGIAAIVAFGIHRSLHPTIKEDEDKPSEEEILKEEMDRILEPIEDEETAKKIEDYKEDDE